ncbi:MAG: hypothetical protein Q9195_008717 [Heterodermia aff. obscurata]
MSTEQPIPTPNGVVPNGTTYGDTKTNGTSQPASSHVNGIAAETLHAAATADLAFDSIESTIAAFKTGSFIIVLDAPSRENEGDLICPAQDFTPEKAAFMIRHTSGLICSPLSPALAHSLHLPQMVPLGKNSEVDGTAYTVSVDALADGMTTGISACDRAMTCRKLSDPAAQPGDFRRPGHVFPLRAREGGVRQRRGHTEATVEFCRLAGKREVGAICELVDEGGDGMMRGEACLAFGRRWGIKVCTIEALVEFLETQQGSV